MGWLWWPFKASRPKGLINFYGLGKWWSDQFTRDKHALVENSYRRSGFKIDSLTTGKISSTNQHVVYFLKSLASGLHAKHERVAAYKILDKAETFAAASSVIDQHFFWYQVLKLNYLDRDQPDNFDTTVRACMEQIAIAAQVAKSFRRQYPGESLPAHGGYERIAIIREKQKAYNEAIEFCKRAKKQGWSGDWDKRIERCSAKLSSQ